MFRLLREYLVWQRTWQEKENLNIRSDYLKLGGEEYPAYFNLHLVEEILRQMEVTHPEPEEDDGFLNSGLCYFCRRNLELTDYKLIRDETGRPDRKVCSACYDRLIHDPETLKTLARQVEQDLCGTYQITLPQIRHYRFRSARDMNKRVKRKTKRGRIVGLAEWLTRTVSVEGDSPKEYILMHLAHEITHMWQFASIRCDDITAMEGHSSYMEVRYMHDLGYTDLEKYKDNNLRHRTDDPYGAGYLKLLEAMKDREDGNPFHYMLEAYPLKAKADSARKK